MARLFQNRMAHLRVAEYAPFTQPLHLNLSRSQDTLPYHSRRFRLRHRCHILVLDARHMDMNVDAVEQRPRNLPRVAFDLVRRAVAALLLIAKIAARTRIHCHDQNDTRGKRQRRIDTCHSHSAILQRLAQDFQRRLTELRQLVEKQHAVMRERHLARTRDAAAADHRHRRRRMMRTAKGTRLDEAAAVLQEPRDAVDLRHLKRLLPRHRRQNRRQAPREHRLARARHADHQQVMPSCRRNLQRTLGEELPLHIGKVIRRHFCITCRSRCRFQRKQFRLAQEKIVQLAQVFRRIHSDAVNEQRFTAVARRNEDFLEAMLLCPDRHGEHAAHTPKLPLQRKLRRKQGTLHALCWNQPIRRQKPDGDRQIESRAVLSYVRRRKIDRHPRRFEFHARILDRRAHTLTRLLHRRIKKPDNVERRKSIRNINLDIDDPPIDPESHRTIRFSKHKAAPLFDWNGVSFVYYFSPLMRFNPACCPWFSVKRQEVKPEGRQPDWLILGYPFHLAHH